ncbi:hypothetical protein L9F63_001438, partial [Diploptera punctata]
FKLLSQEYGLHRIIIIFSLYKPVGQFHHLKQVVCKLEYVDCVSVNRFASVGACGMVYGWNLDFFFLSHDEKCIQNMLLLQFISYGNSGIIMHCFNIGLSAIRGGNKSNKSKIIKIGPAFHVSQHLLLIFRSIRYVMRFKRRRRCCYVCCGAASTVFSEAMMSLVKRQSGLNYINDI